MTKTPIRRLILHLFSKKVTIGLEKVTILNGYSVEYEVFYYQKDKRLTLKKISYKKGTINGVYITKDTNDNLLYKTQFTDGSGYWKDFYYESGNIKEEGKVENNCKVGEWKYYNKNGTIDSLKIYSIKDSVDVRFPHCLFNKNEPCYWENMTIQILSGYPFLFIPLPSLPNASAQGRWWCVLFRVQ